MATIGSRTAFGIGCLALALCVGPRSIAALPALVVEIIDETAGGNGALFAPYGVGVDARGNVFVTTLTSGVGVYQIAPSGVVTVADSGGGLVVALTVDAAGDVYVVEQSQHTATRITPGVGSTEIIDDSGDGAGNPLELPSDVAVGPDGHVYVAGGASRNVFEITPGGSITEILHASTPMHPLGAPADVEVDAAGNVYVADATFDKVLKITPGGAITRILSASGDGAGNTLDRPYGLAVSEGGDVYVSGGWSDNVFRVTPSGAVTQVLDVTGNGSGHTCEYPSKMVLDPEENLYVTCWDSARVLRVAPDGTVTELMDATGDGAGNPLDRPHGLAYQHGRLYVVGTGTHNAFRVVLPTNVPLPLLTGPVLLALILASASAHLRRRTTRLATGE